MPKDKQEQQNNRETTLAGLRPFVSYRHKEDDKIRKVFNVQAKERRAKGLPVFGSPSRKD